MNTEQIRKFVERYLEATDCQIIEKQPSFITVKLSPEADKALTNRPYYWSFVERTGAEPETMSMQFIFDPDEHARYVQKQQAQAAQRDGQAPVSGVGTGVLAGQSTGQNAMRASGSILGTYFGFTPNSGLARVRQETITFGSGRLNQIFDSARKLGTYVHLYEQPDSEQLVPGQPTGYTSYLSVNFKVEFICDMKRDELHSLGICLSTGEIYTNFQDELTSRVLTPRLPAHTHLNDMLSLPRAAKELEDWLERHVKRQDHTWAAQAEERMHDEWNRIRDYYQEMIQNSKDAEEKRQIEDEYRSRQEEITWQFKPRVQVSAVGCGIFHLLRPVAAHRMVTNAP